ELVRRGAVVRGLVRDGSQAALARDRGAAEIARADLRDERSLDRAAAGGDGVFAEPFPKTARVARADYRDVAEVAAIALTGDLLA
uniref:hypothetical protein n=1 Tax=Escherichia coli TaxID=562 RepID=UPI001954632F